MRDEKAAIKSPRAPSKHPRTDRGRPHHRSRPICLRSFWLCAALLIVPRDGRAQQQVVIDSDLSCPRCRIVVTRAAVLGSIDDPVGFFQAVDLEHDSLGRFIAAPSDDRTQVLVYDARGRLVRRVGRSGEGPGEFKGVYRALPGPGDTLHVFDNALGRWTSFSPDLRLLRTHRTSVVPFRAVFLRGDRLVVHASIPTRDRAGFPLHLMRPDGTVALSFGSTDQEQRPGRDAARWRLLGRADDASVWSAYADRYRIERWGVDGRLHLVLSRDATWFPQWDDYTPARLDEMRPRPEIRGVWQHPDGYLFVAIRVADAKWRRSAAARRAQPGRERPILERTAWSEYTDTIIEVLDVRRHTLVATIRIPQAVDGFTRDGLLYGLRELPSGAEAIDVWRVQVKSP